MRETSRDTRQQWLLFPQKVINKILDHNSFWQITLHSVRVVWLCRTLPHTQSLITSPPAHALPPTLLLQDIWWKDKLRWKRYIFFVFFFTLNLSPVEENSRGSNTDMKRCRRRGSLSSTMNCLSVRKDEWGELEWGSLKSEIAISELSGVFFFYIYFLNYYYYFLSMPSDLQLNCFWRTSVMLRILMRVRLHHKEIKNSLMKLEKNEADRKESEVNCTILNSLWCTWYDHRSHIVSCDCHPNAFEGIAQNYGP